LTLKLSSVHVRPESQYNAGTRVRSAAAGKKIANRIVHAHADDTCL
jgi:hypothetical protein